MLVMTRIRRFAILYIYNNYSVIVFTLKSFSVVLLNFYYLEYSTSNINNPIT